MGDSKELLETLTDKLNAIMKRRSDESKSQDPKPKPQEPKQSGLGPLPRFVQHESNDDDSLDDELMSLVETSKQETEPPIAEKAHELTSPVSKGSPKTGAITKNVANPGAKTTKADSKEVLPSKTFNKGATASISSKSDKLKKPAAAVSSLSSKPVAVTTKGSAASKSADAVLKKSTTLATPAKAGKVPAKNVDGNSASTKKLAPTDKFPNFSDADSIPFMRSVLDDLGPEELEEFNKSDGGSLAEMLHQDSINNVESDLKDMQARLEESYKMFNNLSAQLDSISFSTLKDRIKDLKLTDKNSDTVTNLRQQFEESYKCNRLDQLTDQMSEEFKKHPGEFGDIPEISVFFKACTQFQNGVNLLKKQQEEEGSLWSEKSKMGDSKELLETLTDKLNAIMKRRSDESKSQDPKPKPQEPKQSGLGPLPRFVQHESNDDDSLDDELMSLVETSKQETEPPIAEKAHELTSPVSKGSPKTGAITKNVANPGAKTTKADSKEVLPSKTFNKGATASISSKSDKLKKPAAAVSSLSSKPVAVTTKGSAASKSADAVLKKSTTLATPAKVGKVPAKNVDGNSASTKKLAPTDKFPNFSDADSIPFMRSVLDDLGPEELEEFNKSDGGSLAEMLHQDSINNVESDLKDMQARLEESYKMFNNLSAQLDSISFSTLKDRIKDLKLTDKNSDTVTNLRQQFEESYKCNRLDQLTDQMSEEFKKHPGEFGDIPEISVFFKACTQFQNGVNLLKKQQEEADSLVRRVSLATEASHDRIDEICKEMGISPAEDETEQD